MNWLCRNHWDCHIYSAVQWWLDNNELVDNMQQNHSFWCQFVLLQHSPWQINPLPTEFNFSFPIQVTSKSISSSMEINSTLGKSISSSMAVKSTLRKLISLLSKSFPLCSNEQVEFDYPSQLLKGIRSVSFLSVWKIVKESLDAIQLQLPAGCPHSSC